MTHRACSYFQRVVGVQPVTYTQDREGPRVQRLTESLPSREAGFLGVGVPAKDGYPERGPAKLWKHRNRAEPLPVTREWDVRSPAPKTHATHPERHCTGPGALQALVNLGLKSTTLCERLADRAWQTPPNAQSPPEPPAKVLSICRRHGCLVYGGPKSVNTCQTSWGFGGGGFRQSTSPPPYKRGKRTRNTQPTTSKSWGPLGYGASIRQ